MRGDMRHVANLYDKSTVINLRSSLLHHTLLSLWQLRGAVLSGTINTSQPATHYVSTTDFHFLC